MNGQEEVILENKLVAIIIRHHFSQDGLAFFTPLDFSQQLGYMKRPAHYTISPHVHKIHKRPVFLTQETLFLKKGKVRVDFYSETHEKLDSRILKTGDIILLAAGGHGFEFLEESEIIEVKQGPYIGDEDKVRF